MPAAKKAPYNLHVPILDDLADVPADFDALATTITTALNMKLDKSDSTATTPTDTVANYQKRIIVLDAVPTSGAGFVENQIIFVAPPPPPA